MFKVTGKFLIKGKKRKIFTKLFSIGVSASLMLAMVPNNGAFAADTVFVASAKANHWGRSDLRAYLNNVTKTNNTLPIDSTKSGSNSANYPSHFSDDEYALVQPFTYSTNVLNVDEEATAVYETTDKFWLPSGNLSSDEVLSWAVDDLSSTSQYAATAGSDKSRVIPVSYWGIDDSQYSWLRSPDFTSDSYGIAAYRGNNVFYDYVDHNCAALVALKIDLSSVIFSSAASAASIAAVGGAKKIKILWSSDFGRTSTNGLPDYGMYLKTSAADDASFGAKSLSLSDSNLTVAYDDGDVNKYVVVHAFAEDSLPYGHTSYVAAGQITSANSSLTIDVSNWTDANGNAISSLDGYTIKVWMEDASTGVNLAPATDPVTFVGSDGSISVVADGSESKNARVFAMKEDLQTSWGDLSALSDTAYKNVISGTGQSGSDDNSVHGVNPTNQKIYFGTDSDGNPLEFWIAGRETAANGGTIDASGNIMTLYQAKAVEGHKFNNSRSNYAGWGAEKIISGIKHYIADDGTTSVEISEKNKDENNIIWLKEESNGSSAWYGLDNSSKIFEEGSRFYVQWLNKAEHPDAFEDIDEEILAGVEDGKAWLFNIGVTKPDGERYEDLTGSVDIYIQIGADWNKTDLEGLYITEREDEMVPVTFDTVSYPDGTSYFGVMTLSHFSPYFIYDKLTAEEKAGNSFVKTGDEVIYFTISSLGLIMTLALGLMLNSKINRKKIDE